MPPAQACVLQWSKRDPALTCYEKQDSDGSTGSDREPLTCSHSQCVCVTENSRNSRSTNTAARTQNPFVKGVEGKCTGRKGIPISSGPGWQMLEKSRRKPCGPFPHGVRNAYTRVGKTEPSVHQTKTPGPRREGLCRLLLPPLWEATRTELAASFPSHTSALEGR